MEEIIYFLSRGLDPTSKRPNHSGLDYLDLTSKRLSRSELDSLDMTFKRQITPIVQSDTNSASFKARRCFHIFGPIMTSFTQSFMHLFLHSFIHSFCIHPCIIYHSLNSDVHPSFGRPDFGSHMNCGR